MGTCLSKKKGSSTSFPETKSASTASAVSEVKNSSGNGISVSKPKVEGTELEIKQKKENNTAQVQEKHESVQEDLGHVKKEIFIIKHRKSHDDRERNSKSPPNISQQNLPPQVSTFEASELIGEIEKNTPATATNIGVGVRTSNCTKEEVDAILIHCGRLSRSSSSAAAAASGEKHRRKYSGSKRSFDFDHCENDTISTDEDQTKANVDLCEDDGEKPRQHRPRRRHSPSPRPSSQERRRRTPSREREQQQQPSSRERRVSRSPGRRSSETTTSANARNNSSNSSSRPGKMVSVPATVSSLVMDKSNNGGGGGDSAATTGVKRITVRRNVGVASPRSQSPARTNGNAGNGSKALGENQQQQQPSLSRNNSRKAEQSPYRRNPLSEIDPNSVAFPHSTGNNNSRVQNRSKRELETEPNQKPNGSRTALDKGVSVNCKTKAQQEEDVQVQSSMIDNVVVKTVIPPGVDNLKPQTLTRNRSSRRSCDFDLNTDAPLIPPHSYTSLLLEDIQNFHQKSTPSVPLPACVTKACSILEAVADLNSNNSNGKRVLDANEPVVESILFDNDDVMEPSLHKYVTVNRGGSLNGVDMEDQESSGSNSFTVSSGQNYLGISTSSSWEPSSVDSKDCWSSRMNCYTREGQKNNAIGLEGIGVDGGAKEKLNCKRRECDHEHAGGIGRSRYGTNKIIHTIPVVTAAAST